MSNKLRQSYPNNDGISQWCSDESDSGGLAPLFDPMDKIVAEVEKACEHMGTVAEYLVDFSV